MKHKLPIIALSALLCGGLTLSALYGGIPNPLAGVPGQAGDSSPRSADAAPLPFFEDFSEETSLDGWSQVNNATQCQWVWDQYDFNVMLSQRNVMDKTGCDNWLITPAFQLESGKTYRVSFDVQNWFESDMHTYLVTSPTDPEEGKTLLLDYVGQEWGNKSAEFEVPSSGIYYIGIHDETPWRENGTALSYELSIDNFRMEMMSDNAVPEVVGDLRQVPGRNGEISMGLEWTNPSLSKQGEELDGLSGVKVYKDGRLALSIETGVEPGQKMTWTDEAPTAGEHTYSVVVSNTTGESDAAVVDTFCGIDLPGAPENFAVDYDAEAGIITLDWEQPQFGVRGGWYDPTGITYRVVRQPGNTTLVTDLADEIFEDTDISEYGNYVYQVTTRTPAGLGGTAVSSGVLVEGVASLPLYEGWEDPSTLPVWTIVDNNQDGNTLGVGHKEAYNSGSAIGYNPPTINDIYDETLFSPPVRLEKGKRYRSSFYVKSHQMGSWSMSHTYGKEKNAGRQTVTVLSYTDVCSPEFSPAEAEFTADETGTFYFAWHLFNADKFVWMDDFRIEEILDNNMEATSVTNLNTAPSPGDQLTTGVTYTNKGSGNSSPFTVQLIDDDNNVLGEQTVSRPLGAGASATANIRWTVPAVIGEFAVRGRVVMDGDQCGRDNTTLPVRMNIQKDGVRAITIGTSSDLSTNAPFKHYGGIYSETIYKGEDFGNIAGTMKKIAFKVRFGIDQDYPAVPFRLYVGNTDQDNLFSGWIPSTYLTKVFEGPIDINRGVYELEIPFDTPFDYAGGNLCVLLIGDHDPELMLNNGYGMASYVSEYGLGATRTLPGNAVLNAGADPSQEFGSYYPYAPNAIFYIDHSNTTSVSGTVRDAEGNPLEGVEVCGAGWNTSGLKTLTDKDGRYEMPYHPAGYASLKASMKGYEDGNGSSMIAVGEPAVIDITMNRLVEITFKGNVVNNADGSAVAGAEITLSGDNELTAVTDPEGRFEIEGVFANKAYPVFTIEAEGYTTASYGGMRFWGSPETPYEWNDISLNPVTSSPYSVTALDKGDKAEISWTTPIENVIATKSEDSVAGNFGGAYNMLVGHRYTSAELRQLGVDGDYYVQSVSFVPMSCSKFTLSVWQGEEGNETLVYQEVVEPATYGNWNEFILSKPCKVDPEKSLVVGYTVDALTGAFPIGFDFGPVVEGGDCLFNPDMNAWTTAHELLPGQMNYNWSIRATFGNYPNSAPVEWLPSEQPARAMRLGDPVTIDDVMAAGNGKPETAPLSQSGFELFDSPVAYCPLTKIPPRTEVKGYNVYRLEPGTENSGTWAWTRLNETPVTEMNFVDETWKDLEDKPYRFAVTSFYGNRSEYGDGVTSAATFSDGVDKGRYATLTVNVSTDYGTVDGAVVNLIGDGKSVQKTVGAGESSVTFEDVRFTDYTVVVLKPYFATSVTNITVDDKEMNEEVTLAFAAPAPSEFDATDYISEARLAWNAPTSAVTADLFVGDQIPTTEYTLQYGTEYIVGQRSDPEMRVNYSYGDFWFDAISFYANAAVTYSPLIWEESVFGQQTQLVRMDYTVSDYEVGSWITVRLDSPIKLNPDNTYFFGYAASSSEGKAPFVIDGDNTTEQGCWYYMMNQMTWRYEWTRVASSGSFMVSAHITDTPNPDDIRKEDVKFDIYRLMTADAEDESKWAKLTSEPVEDELYTDTTWEPLEDADWQYAVKAVFDGGATSVPAMSKVMPKGKVALVNVDLTTDNGLSAQGARMMIERNGKTQHSAEADANGHIEIPEVSKNSRYTARIVLPAYEEINESMDISDNIVNLAYELNEVREIPGFVEAFPALDNSSVEISWRKPGEYAPREGWVYWDDAAPYGGYGTSTGFCAAAQLFMPEDQEAKGMKELDITRISIFPTSSSSNPVDPNSTWIAKIWRINSDMSVDEVATGTGVDITLDTWNEIEFDTPYHVSGDENLLVGYEFHGQGNAMGIDDGPTVINKGDWANFGNGWTTLQTAADGFNYNNLIHTYCENLFVTTGHKAPAIAESQSVISDAKGIDVKVSRANRAAKSAEHPLLAPVVYPVKGYKVYRLPAYDRDDESTWTLLTPEAVTETSLIDDTWKNVGSGLYSWAVKALYATGESAPAFCGYSVDENGNISDVEEVAVADDMTVTRISHDTILVNVPADGNLTVSDTAGIVVLTTDLSAGENVIRLDIIDGVYLLHATYGGKTRTFKLMTD